MIYLSSEGGRKKEKKEIRARNDGDSPVLSGESLNVTSDLLPLLINKLRDSASLFLFWRAS